MKYPKYQIYQHIFTFTQIKNVSKIWKKKNPQPLYFINKCTLYFTNTPINIPRNSLLIKKYGTLIYLVGTSHS